MTIAQYRQVLRAIKSLRESAPEVRHDARLAVQASIRAARDGDEYDEAICDVLRNAAMCDTVGIQIEQAVDLAICVRHTWHRDPRFDVATRIE